MNWHKSKNDIDIGPKIGTYILETIVQNNPIKCSERKLSLLQVILIVLLHSFEDGSYYLIGMATSNFYKSVIMIRSYGLGVCKR